MKMKKSVFAVAIALAAVAGAANAAVIDPPNTGNGELFLTVWDPTSGNEASFNLGLNVHMNDFNGASSYSYNVSSDSVFQSYFGAIQQAEQSAWKWNVTTGDTNPDSERIMSTAGTVPSLANNAVSGASSYAQDYAANFSTCNSCGTNVAGSAAYAGTNYGTNFNGSQAFDNSGVIGQSLAFFEAQNTTGDGTYTNGPTDPAAMTTFAGSWTLDANGTLSYGTAGAGARARRRMAAGFRPGRHGGCGPPPRRPSPVGCRWRPGCLTDIQPNLFEENIMKVKAISLAIGAAIAVGAAAQASAAAAAPFEPWQVTGSETFTVRIGGSTAQDNGLVLLMRHICDTNSMTRVDGQKSSVMMCQANGVNSGTIPGGTKIVVYKESQGGSGNGVGPVANATSLNFLNLASLQQSDYTNAGTCTLTTTASTADFADYKNYACGTSIATSAVAPDAGISDVEPALLGYQPGIDGAIASSAGPQVIFGVPVSKNFRDALQTAQSSRLGAGCAVGSNNEECMPSLTKAEISSMLNGGLLQVKSLSDENGNALVAPGTGIQSVFGVCRRKTGSGTLASFNAYFLNYPCAKGVQPMTSYLSGGTSDGDAQLPNLPNRIEAYGGTKGVIGCLNAMNTAGRYAIGMSGMEFAVGGAYANTGLAGDWNTDSGNWGWVKVNGYSPSLLNVAQTRYDFMVEGTYNYRAAGNPNGALAGDQKTLADLVIATNSSAAVIKQLDANLVQVGGWYTGLMGKPSAGTPTSPSSVGHALTAADVAANPINTWTRTVTQPNTCQPPYVTKETGLDMLM